MKIEVTQEDIDRGHRLSITGCPLARALSRVLGQAVLAGGTELVLFAGTRRECSIPLPPKMREFRLYFDRHDRAKVESTTFEIADDHPLAEYMNQETLDD